MDFAPLIDSICETVNQFIRTLIGRGALIDCKCTFNADKNPATEIANGHLTFDIEFMPPTPAERITFIPKDITSYIEPFGGAGWVLFYKDRWADLEIYNDLDGRLVNLFRIVKYHPNALKEELQYLLGSREMFLQFLNGTFITDIQKAAQFLFLITRSFGGRGDTFGTVKKSSGGASKSQRNVLEKIDAIHKRLDKVMVENRDFEKLIKQYDFEGAFFY